MAYKGFKKGLVCRNYQFQNGKNVTEEANCAYNGFHCAENPLDCLTYYPDMESAEYYVVNAGGDLDEDDRDSKIACTELTILQKLTPKQFFLHGLAYMADHPKRPWANCVSGNCAKAHRGFAVVRGPNPIASGRLGDILALAKEEPGTGRILQIALFKVDGELIFPEKWYDIDKKERKGSFHEKETTAAAAVTSRHK